MAGHSVQQVLQGCNWHGLVPSGADKVLSQLRDCRTAQMGWHLSECTGSSCKGSKMQYHSCHNRHCPNCGWSRKEEWVEARMRELVPCSYVHVVFTLPSELHSLVLGNRALLFNLLFEASAYTLLRFSSDKKVLGATPGIVSVLHTWGQQLSFHPHIHCIVSGGGITSGGIWQKGSGSKNYVLYPVKAMRVVYRGYFLGRLKQLAKKGVLRMSTAQKAGFALLLSDMNTKEWIVYAKKPFGGPQQVIEYLGRYTHKVAISNQRLTEVGAERVRFRYRDYRDENREKELELSLEEFVRRFAQHILPYRYVRIRSYGMYANRNRQSRVEELRKKEGWSSPGKALVIPAALRLLLSFGKDVNQCPVCKTGRMRTVETVSRSQVSLPQKVPWKGVE